MSHVVTESCIACKYTDCVEFCPVDCFHEGENFLVINPDECIDCSLCVSECPVNAIKSQYDLSQQESHYLKLNAEFSQIWPIIRIKKTPLEDAERMAKVNNKYTLLMK